LNSKVKLDLIPFPKEGTKVSEIEKENLLNKLRFIPKDELVRLILKLCKDDKALEEIIKSELNLVTLSPFKKINHFSADMLIKIISKIENISPDLIETLYAEYVHTKYPSIFLSVLETPKWLDFGKFKEILPKIFEKYSKIEFEFESDPSFKNLQLISEPFQENAIIELIINYQRRIDFINPDTKEPTYVYGLETGLVWILTKQNSVITKLNHNIINKVILEILTDLLKCKSHAFSLNHEIIDKMFGLDSIKKGNYYHPDPGPDKVSSKTLRDPNLMKKVEAQETNKLYDRKSSFHTIEGLRKSNETSLSVDSKLGKISIKAHIKKSDLRNWVQNINDKIINYMDEMKTESPALYIKNFNLDEIKSIESIKSNKGKEVLIQLFDGITAILKKGIPEFRIIYPLKIIINTLKEYTTPLFNPICSKCDTTQFTCENCHHSSFKFNNQSGKIRLLCRNCEKEIEDIQTQIACENNHHLETTLEENTIVLLNSSCKELIFNLIKEFSLELPFHLDDTIMIESGLLKILKMKYKSTYLFDELPAFKDIPSINAINRYTIEQQEENLNNILNEKCKHYRDTNCRSCLRKKAGDCLQRVVAYFTNGTLHAHSGSEFGDISFDQIIDGKTVKIIGLVKSYSAAPQAGHKFTLKNNAGLLNQVFDYIEDERI